MGLLVRELWAYFTLTDWRRPDRCQGYIFASWPARLFEVGSSSINEGRRMKITHGGCIPKWGKVWYLLKMFWIWDYRYQDGGIANSVEAQRECEYLRADSRCRFLLNPSYQLHNKWTCMSGMFAIQAVKFIQIKFKKKFFHLGEYDNYFVLYCI